MYRVYVTDTLMYMAQNTGRAVSEGVAPAKRWIEMTDPKEEDERTGDEVALEVIRKLGLEVKKDVTI